jgi:hypothetical protein
MTENGEGEDVAEAHGERKRRLSEDATVRRAFRKKARRREKVTEEFEPE